MYVLIKENLENAYDQKYKTTHYLMPHKQL